MNPRTPGAAPSPAGGPLGRGASSFPMTPSPANPMTPASPAGGAVNRGPGANQPHASPGDTQVLLVSWLSIILSVSPVDCYCKAHNRHKHTPAGPNVTNAVVNTTPSH